MPELDTVISLHPQANSSCCLEIDRVLTGIESSDVRKVVGVVFGNLLRLIECLTLAERYLRQADAADETFALFELIHGETRLLVDFIRGDGMNCAGMSNDLIDTLDGIAFAVNHDLQRAFESQEQATRTTNVQVRVGKLYRAHDVLTNCLQQSTITLAMVFDPELPGSRLFNTSDMRYRQSLKLCKDLSELLKFIELCEAGCNESTRLLLSTSIDRFRDESLECLMYSDWPQFESFCERIKLVGTTAPDLESVLHQFHCYVETLLGQVRMRTVLANVYPLHGVGSRSHVATEATSSQFQATDLNHESDLWGAFAVAM
ncbi:MAG TPA: hypothetical protein VMZ30_10425 [Pyrinomonadaceae bacterium]|nr:hypothetical protein [Pyrinomonadaceae bacterium]